MEKTAVTQEQIDAWKEKYGHNKVKQLDIPLNEDQTEILTVYARVPDLRILNEWEKWSDKNPQKAKEILVNSCLLTGHSEVKADQEIFLGVYSALTELISLKKALVKNL